MERDPALPAGPAPGLPPGPARRAWNSLVDGLAALGTLLIGVLMIIICSDVAARNLLGASLPLVAELGALTLVMIVYLQLATTIRHDRLARTELFLTPLKRRHPRAGAVLGALFDAAGAAALGVIAWSTLGILQRDVGSGQFIGVTGVMTLPTWPFRLLITAGAAVSAVQFCLQVFDAFRLAAAPRTGAGA